MARRGTTSGSSFGDVSGADYGRTLELCADGPLTVRRGALLDSGGRPAGTYLCGVTQNADAAMIDT